MLNKINLVILTLLNSWASNTNIEMYLWLFVNLIKFYSLRDARNVVVIHCLDGKSSTAYGKNINIIWWHV